MKLSAPIILTIALFAAFASAIFWINQNSQETIPDTWTAFVYHHGFGSANYLKKEGFTSYQQCREYATTQSAKYENSPWECGGGCRFDSRRQGYVCEEMRNH
ncbi:hypothetical protein KDN34_02085 [Shewanella yunxiaonensis]|uniref:Orphan protein n=1 Tax=Shewanella yunxiaonensis TaxID=2829809 RepID=A0ABX7YW22_9GAMM|nr:MULTISPECIES: hypothetical protein [Shewanella]MDF0534733.1 hypothetical protein [Shewanella sp. A32]QUN06281.1 hypothetical protein KDN34_02085 [Shewanella yunxiaonensis]